MGAGSGVEVTELLPRIRGSEDSLILYTDLVYSVSRGGVSTEEAPHLLTTSTGGGAGRERPRPPDVALSLLGTGGAVTSTDSTPVQHLPAPQPQVAADTLTLASQAD